MADPDCYDTIFNFNPEIDKRSMAGGRRPAGGTSAIFHKCRPLADNSVEGASSVRRQLRIPSYTVGHITLPSHDKL